MGREIRRVPPNWEHPTKEYPNYRLGTMEVRYQPMYDRALAPAMREWIADWDAWERGERPDYCSEESKILPYWEWSGGPPDPEYYRPDWQEGLATWWQVYETVSEGSPVSPPFATQQELVDYLVEHGDFWDQKRRQEGRSRIDCAPWSKESATAFVFGSGWAPSLVVVDGKVMTGVEFMATPDPQQEQP